MAIENVRHPIKDTVKADNSTYSSNKIESLIHSATELPATSVEDIGKVVTVVSDGDEGAEYGLETISTESPVLTYIAYGLMFSGTSGTLICPTLSEKDLADAFDAGKIVRIVAHPTGIDTALEMTIDNKKIVIHKEDLFVFDLISKSEGAGASKYWFESRFGYDHPQSGDTTRNLIGIVRMYFSSNLTRTAVSTSFTAKFDVDGLKNR